MMYDCTFNMLVSCSSTIFYQQFERKLLFSILSNKFDVNLFSFTIFISVYFLNPQYMYITVMCTKQPIIIPPLPCQSNQPLVFIKNCNQVAGLGNDYSSLTEDLNTWMTLLLAYSNPWNLSVRCIFSCTMLTAFAVG